MPRINENDGQEVTFEDLNRIHQVIERELFERLIYSLCGKADGFFQDSMLVNYVDGTHVLVSAGVGVQLDNTQVDPEPIRREIYLASATGLTVTTPDASLPRIDIVCVKADRANTKTETRQVKDFVSKTVAPQSLVIETDWQATLQLVAGTPNASPVAPSVPSGYIKIATLAVSAATGLASSAAVTDNRILMPINDLASINTSAFVQVATKAAAVPLKQVLRELDTAVAAAATKTALVNILLTGTVDGTNAAFSLGATSPVDTNSVIPHVDGVKANPSEYSYSSGTVTFNAGSIPAVGQIVSAVVAKLI